MLYVSFDDQSGRRAPGHGLVAAKALNGKKRRRRRAERRPDRQQRVPVQGRVRLGPEAAVHERDPQEGPEPVRARLGQPEGLTIFQRMLTKTSNKIDGVAAANDGLANAVVSPSSRTASSRSRSAARTRPTQGVQNIISGWQTMTVYKDVSESWRPRSRQRRSRSSRARRRRRPASSRPRAAARCRRS